MTNPKNHQLPFVIKNTNILRNSIIYGVGGVILILLVISKISNDNNSSLLITLLVTAMAYCMIMLFYTLWYGYYQIVFDKTGITVRSFVGDWKVEYSHIKRIGYYFLGGRSSKEFIEIFDTHGEKYRITPRGFPKNNRYILWELLLQELPSHVLIGTELIKFMENKRNFSLYISETKFISLERLRKHGEVVQEHIVTADGEKYTRETEKKITQKRVVKVTNWVMWTCIGIVALGIFAVFGSDSPTRYQAVAMLIVFYGGAAVLAFFIKRYNNK